MSFFRFCRQGLTALPVFFMLMACDKLLSTGGSGELVPVKIRSVSVKGYGEASATRSAGGEKRIVGQPIIQDLGDGMLAEITIGEDISALRDATKLENNKTFRVIALKHDDQTYLSHADFTVGGSSNYESPDLHVPQGLECDFICYSYNNADPIPTLAFPNLVVDTSKDLLYNKITETINNVESDLLSFTMTQQYAKVTLKLAAGTGKTITSIADNSISLNAASSGSFNLKDGEFSSSSGSINFSNWSGTNSTEVTSGAVTFIPQEKYTFFFAAEAILWKDGATTGKTTEGPIGSFQFKFTAGSSYTVTLTILRLPRFAGSNIYWDGNQLTFDPYGINNDHAKYQGIYFQWGSLIGVAAGGASEEDYTSGSTILYKPINTDAALGTARTWEETDDTDDAWSGSGWENIPCQDDGMPEDETLFSQGATGFTGFKGDICYYIDQNYRMPTKNELDSLTSYHKAFIGGAISESKADGTYEVTTQYTTLAGIIFPASGCRYTDSGKLLIVGDFGFYWSGSAISGTNNAYGAIFVGNDFNMSDIHKNYGLPVRCVLIE